MTGTATASFHPMALITKYLPRQIAQGPRLRFGVVWFALLSLAMIGGSFAVALLFSLTGALASLQAVGQWRARRTPVNQLVAGFGGAALPLAAWGDSRWVGATLLVLVGAAVVLGSGLKPTAGSVSLEAVKANLPVVAATLRCSMFIGLAGAAVVQVERIDALSIIFLAALVSMYDAGDYLVGAGQRNRLIGVGAGLLGAVAVTLTMTAVYPQSLWSDSAVRTVGIAAALGCPAGQMLGTWILPSSRAKAPALRRLDAWLVAAPVFLIGALLST